MDRKLSKKIDTEKDENIVLRNAYLEAEFIESNSSEENIKEYRKMKSETPKEEVLDEEIFKRVINYIYPIKSKRLFRSKLKTIKIIMRLSQF